MTTLDTILDHCGFDARTQQTDLYWALLATTTAGTVAQAGTGVGKSLAIMAAAYDWRKRTGLPTVIVTPTNALLDQYVNADAPRVSKALGARIRVLKGRNRYLCENSSGFTGGYHGEWEMRELLDVDGEAIVEPERSDIWGCPGSEVCTPKSREGNEEEGEDPKVCHYARAKAEVFHPSTDIIITNSHLLILHRLLRGKVEILPDFGAILIDEGHVFESTIRDFGQKSIALGNMDELGTLAMWMKPACEKLQAENAKPRAPKRYEFPLTYAGPLERGLVEMAGQVVPRKPGSDDEPSDGPAESAKRMTEYAKQGRYDDGRDVLWLKLPTPEEAKRQAQPRLISTPVDVASTAQLILTQAPYAIVSATIPKSLPASLGIRNGRFLDVGHPFDYSRQAWRRISSHTGLTKANGYDRRHPDVITTTTASRLAEVRELVLKAKGGALLLFPSYADLNLALHHLGPELRAAGLDVRAQEDSTVDRTDLGRWFTEHGNAVLFGTDSFATGFDCPGEALRLVVVWRLPYPPGGVVNDAIKARSWQRYEDAMLIKVTQGIGRLIRKESDTGVVFVADSRGHEKLFDKSNPMIKHISEFQHY